MIELAQTNLKLEDFEDIMEKVFASPPMGTERHFWMFGKWWRTIVGQGVVSVRNDDEEDYRKPTEAEVALIALEFLKTEVAKKAAPKPVRVAKDEGPEFEDGLLIEPGLASLAPEEIKPLLATMKIGTSANGIKTIVFKGRIWKISESDPEMIRVKKSREKEWRIPDAEDFESVQELVR